MHRQADRIYFSASDLADFVSCRHCITLGLLNLDQPLPKKAADEELQILQNLGEAHEQAHLQRLRLQDLRVQVISRQPDFGATLAATQAALHGGADIIFQAALADGPFRGYADFLYKIPIPSALGPHAYEVADTKLALKGKARHLVQVALYADLLAAMQGVLPAQVHLVMGDGTDQAFRLSDYQYYVAELKQRFLTFVQAPPATTPEKCAHCGICDWQDHCQQAWCAADHLNQVANIRAGAIRKLQAAGIHTLAKLAAQDQPVPGIGNFATLHHQAQLQLRRLETGADQIAFKTPDPQAQRGFYALPEPSAGDLYFDMEGYPHQQGGLEYLFGLSYREGEEVRFQPFWGHNRAEEKQAFADCVDFMVARIHRYPDLHIYHYADYERRAFEKLMQLHGTREAEVDQFFRDQRLVDLYAVVRNAILTSEPRSSIKNLETFYMKGERSADVKNAGASIVYYERWRQDHDPRWLEQIERYNEEDCVSTAKLHAWLLGLRVEAEWQFAVTMPWKTTQAAAAAVAPRTPSDQALALANRKQAVRDRLSRQIAALTATAPRTPVQSEAELVLYLLDFYWREAKPVFWKMFSQRDMSLEQLYDDLDALAGLTADPQVPPTPDKQSLIYRFQYQEQEHRLRVKDQVHDTATLLPVGELIALDTEHHWLHLRVGKRTLAAQWGGQLPSALSIAAKHHVDTSTLDAALLRFAESEGDTPYAALHGILQRQWPRVAGVTPGTAVLSGDSDVASIAAAVANLRDSYLVIQGPPGTGKTYTGARVILHLLAQGKRIGVSAISHKAIANLLDAITAAAREQGFSFQGARKVNDDAPLKDDQFIRDVAQPQDALAPGYQLVAGTAWLFARPAADQCFDYLFVDEAGQVSLANLVAMGCAARNIVLLGDQMQLGQPLQGTHPGDSGLSALQYLLRGHPTVPPELGILLNVSRRMHPAVCDFISAAVYEGRLRSFVDTARQRLILGDHADPALKAAGIVFAAVAHQGSAQSCQAEGERILALITALRGQSFVDQQGQVRPLLAENLLVVAPYNAQVNLLRQLLPADIRVGTVDKFQGQEAEVVLISMTTSSGEDLPRNLAFLFDRNRLNVAISRAKTLAIVVASPGLLAIDCTTPEQMALVNTLCWVAAIGHNG